MKELVLHQPTILTIITTNNCTSSCRNCCFQCGPKKQERLTISEMKSYITQAKEAYPSLKLLVLTGGECFTFGKGLVDVIRYATSKYNMYVRIVSNAYWANTLENAHKRLVPYVEAGLNEINFSTGDDHLEYVPLQYIKNACLASVELGLLPLVNIETREDRKFTNCDFLSDVQLFNLYSEKKIGIANGVWVSFKKENKPNVNNRNYLSPPHMRCKNLFTSINIDPNHKLLACCGLTVKYSKYLDLGNLNTTPLRKLFENQFHDFLKIWIYTEGSHAIMKYISQFINIDLDSCNKLHDCQVCAMIFNNSSCLQILQQNYKDVYSNVIMKYYTINNKK